MRWESNVEISRITGAPVMEFHIARSARDRYHFDESLFQFSGNVIFANFHAARVFAQKMNQKRDLARFPEQAVRAGQISAMGLIDEILHYVAATYRKRTRERMLADALAWLNERLGAEKVETALRAFCDAFPPLAVYRREQALDAYLADETGGMPHREVALEEMLMLWLENVNPAFNPFLELFDDAHLEHDTVYLKMIEELDRFFATQPPPVAVLPGITQRTLIELLRAPALASPHSLEGQINYVLEHWAGFLDRSFLYRLLSSLDVIKEEERARFGVGGGDLTGAYVPVADYRYLEAEPERYTPDREWMPRLVLLAKNTFVWLDQLSKWYGRPIKTLDQVPDEELDTMARRGFTGLWLIGLWERSEASKRIKQIMGNPDAVASAYSLYDYQIAAALGGQPALNNLRARAWQRGIRLSADMVPNHVGIDGRWVIEHPDWFIQLPYPPFPTYTFNGPDLSSDERVGIFIEDHYYDRTDAAVVFKRLDRWTGEARYIYHGNDGTSMPWNDTAQLNYLKPEVREAVIQTILHVARLFPIIRFDAAMTLAKRHYHRLWFPEPGTGGDIPSRAGFGMTRAQFDAAMPEEFWREVVDRCAVEAPDTLLLAEAFWLMEGYFVRTLGMHRVYNSAFMVCLRDEENAKYRQIMKNVLEFDPEVLRRFVNFMNNPDERTAVDQFGKGDKYFGVCTMLVTMPGLPMFGHGQIEGFAEKYGMEYYRAYWDEKPDEWLIARHEREIFPLLHRRYLFAGTDNFLLYDFYMPEGHVNEDVFAYSNRHGDERSLVIYHNRYARTSGWVRLSAAFMARTGRGDERALVQRTLAEGLALRAGDHNYTIFRDHRSGLEYIRHSRDLAERGLYVELGPYDCHVFIDFREVTERPDGRYGQITAYLGGRGVPSIDIALREMFLQPVLIPFRSLVSATMLRELAAWADRRAMQRGALPDRDGEEEVIDSMLEEPDARDEPTPEELEALAQRHANIKSAIPSTGAQTVTEPEADELPAIEQFEQQLRIFLTEFATFSGGTANTERIIVDIRRRLETVIELLVCADAHHVQLIGAPLADDPARWGTAIGWAVLHRLGLVFSDDEVASQSRSLIDEYLLGRALQAALVEFGYSDDVAADAVQLVRALTAHQNWHEEYANDGRALAAALMADGDVQAFTRVNRFQGVLWFNKERFERLLHWLNLIAAVALQVAEPHDADTIRAACARLVASLMEAAEQSGYRVEQLLAAPQSKEPLTL
ncbi:alpha-amylase family glycosyl hydrolase [Roseiflexus castenholzii]|uniref:alpha-amylase family glycosyl hydrolase n=1 Tax=Roseiflexus castenholzii TaxID=120962 RepID=UPI003C7BCFF4